MPRVALALVLVLLPAMLLAGCTAPDEPASAATAPSASPTTTAITPTASAPPAAPTSEPAPPAREPSANGNGTTYHGSWSHAFYDAPKDETLVVPPDPAVANITISFVPSNNGSSEFRLDCAGDGRVLILSPNGSALIVAPTHDGDRCSGSTRMDRTPLAAGNWTIRFDGHGDVFAFVIISSEGNAGNDTTPGSPRVTREETHDFAAAESTSEFDVPRFAQPFEIVITYEARVPGTPCVVSGGAIVVTDPADVEVAASRQQGVADTAPHITGVEAPAPGAWSIAFGGTGTCLGRVSIH